MVDVPAQLVAATPTDQASLPGQSVEGPSVYVRDQFDNPVSGILVLFTVTDGGGSVEKSEATTVNGFAYTPKWTLGTTTGHNRVVASSAGLTSGFSSTTPTPTCARGYMKGPTASASAAT